ncbi:MAG TPA: hypothetical protein VK974_05760 [Methylophilaceae bacterium]|nr:hypothetical protein [Methylophilaceae bacterium]
MKNYALVVLSLLAINTAHANEKVSETSDAASSSEEFGIPEPLVFDMVRPLGSPKGEVEVNAFLNQSSSSVPMQWSPEIEYSLADGYAIELQLPYENSRLGEYQVAMQATLPALIEGRMVQGLQGIARKTRHSNAHSADVLYLNGIRFSEMWSTMNMVGARKTAFNGDGEIHGLLNSAWFYHLSSQLILGVEVNNEIHKHNNWHYRLTPQVHYSFDDNKAVQFGVGPSRLADDKKVEKLMALRFVYSF